jgi:hypothetical protein
MHVLLNLVNNQLKDIRKMEKLMTLQSAGEFVDNQNYRYDNKSHQMIKRIHIILPCQT